LESFTNLHNIYATVFISISDISQYPELDLGLVIRSLFVFNDLERY
jgi:hypothetical protein